MRGSAMQRICSGIRARGGSQVALIAAPLISSSNSSSSGSGSHHHLFLKGGSQPSRSIQYKKPKLKRDQNRPMRSVLFTPGSRLSAMKKAITLPADVLTLDLEDSVAYDRKIEARQNVKQLVDEENFGRKFVTVRVNVLGSKFWTDDIAYLAETKIDAIVIPKVNNAEVLITANELLSRYGAHEQMAIWAMVETPHAVMNIKEISAASHVVPRLEALMMGTSDLTNELHALHTPNRVPLIYSLSSCVVAARAFKLRVIDGVHLTLNDPEGFEKACVQGRALGFDGKSLIHPSTVEAANRNFGPLPADIEHAQAVLTAWSEATSKGLGVAVVEGKLIEILHVEEAKRILETQRNIEALDAAYQAFLQRSNAAAAAAAAAEEEGGGENKS